MSGPADPANGRRQSSTRPGKSKSQSSVARKMEEEKYCRKARRMSLAFFSRIGDPSELHIQHCHDTVYCATVE